jgi:hypothetical protein
MTATNNSAIHAAARRLRRLVRPWQVRLNRLRRRLTYRILSALDRLEFAIRLRQLQAQPHPVTVAAPQPR